MNSALYFFSNYVAQYEMKSVVAIIAASSSTFGFFLSSELNETQDNDEFSGKISEDFEKFFFDDELREQIQCNAFFVGQHADCIPLGKLCSLTGGIFQIASFVRHDFSHLNICLNYIRRVAKQFAGIVYNCNFQVNSSHRLNF